MSPWVPDQFLLKSGRVDVMCSRAESVGFDGENDGFAFSKIVDTQWHLGRHGLSVDEKRRLECSPRDVIGSDMARKFESRVSVCRRNRFSIRRNGRLVSTAVKRRAPATPFSLCDHLQEARRRAVDEKASRDDKMCPSKKLFQLAAASSLGVSARLRIVH